MRRKFTILIILIAITALSAIAQNETNINELQRIAIEKAAQYNAEKQVALDYAKLNNIPVIFEAEDGRFFELQRIDEFGKPQYYITENSNSAATISTNNVHPGGSAGLNLDGTGITPREWDAGAVRGTHQEYTGRVVMGDGATTTHYHSTHVAGTIIASGFVSSAKGMAPNASLRAFDWNNDESEMASEAANGALMSNHSYGYGRGWVWDGGSWTWYGNTSISTQEDYLFGFYDSQAQDWDQIAANAPYYLIVKSAGNDRGDGPVGGPYPQDGPYDCISHAGVGKNVLTVGAVEDIPGGYNGPSSVVMSSFSSWGPCDDGRVKPDISTNGISLYSSDHDADNDYTSLSGTSMAAPSATGSLALLQQHYENLNGSGNYMTAATLKALVIHTADEAGSNDGPDYEFGWGLMNTESAALMITENQTTNVIDELSLSNDSTYTRSINVDGTEPLKLTICWTDVPGTPVSAQLDPLTPMLVNDLDLRLEEGSNTYYPWKLDRDNPSNAATNSGENNVDNVEVVYIANPVAGNYTISVDHDGTLSGGSPQAFSIIISGIVSTPVTDPPVADFSANNTNPLTGTPVLFTDLSTNVPTSWTWSFNPSTVTFVNSTNANSQHPQLTFDIAGSYDVTLIATNTYGSDTLTRTGYIVVSDPQPFSLPWTEDFEAAGPPLSITTNTSIINGIPLWSYAKTDNGRLRFQAGSGFCHGGSQAATLDADPSGTVSINYLIATLNLLNYTSKNLLLSYYYMQHGEESSANDRVWIRGSQSEAWVEIYDLFANMAAVGTWKEVSELSITNTLSAAVPPQTVSSTFQIRFGQEDNYPATTTTESDGFTFDDIRIEVALPVVDFTANITSGIPYSTIQFTDLSTRSPTQWEWNFPGATPTSSSQQNPSIEYQETGYFDVTLTGTNASGSSFLSKADYILIHNDNTIFYDDFETMAGWTLTNEFEIDTPGAAGGEHGNPDPPGAYEGSKALGVDITGTGAYSGDYEANLTDRQCQAVSPTFDCSAYSTVTLSFMRWLNVEQPLYDHAYIDIFDGTSWNTLWSNTATIEDNSWSLQEYDISSFAANQPVVQVRFSVGVTDGSWVYSGWNIDNLRITTAFINPTLHNISWTGAQDSIWNNAPNWSNGQVPGVNTNVTIPAFVPGGIMPKVFSQPSNVIHNLNIEPGAEIIITTGDTLIIRE